MALDGWQLRAMRGVTRRANSVWPGEAYGSSSLQERLEKAEAFYKARGLPVCFYICPVSEPSGLDAELERRGYRREGGVSVQSAAPERILERPLETAGCVLETRPSTRYLELAVHGARYASVPDVYSGLLGRVLGRAWYASAEHAGLAGSVALAVRHGPDLGLFSMLTRPEARRRGLAESLIRALAQHALQIGIEALFLQVELENTAALRLYAKCGFVERYQYHYRVSEPSE